MPIRSPNKLGRPYAMLDAHGTIIRSENTAFELVQRQIEEGFIQKPKRVLAAIKEARHYLSGIGYERAATDFFASHAQSLRGQPKAEVDIDAQKLWHEKKDQLMLPHSEPILEELRRRKYFIVIASGGSSIEIDAMSSVIDVDMTHSTKFETAENSAGEEVFTGRLENGFLSSAKKGGIAYELNREFGRNRSLVMGNRKEGDIGPLYAAEQGVCVMPNDELIEVAGWCGLMLVSEEQAMARELPEPLRAWLEASN